MTRSVEIGGVCLLMALAVVGCAPDQSPGESPIPRSSGQMVLVLSESFDASSGMLSRFERDPSGGSWEAVSDVTPITLGRNGLGLGSGLHRIDPGSMPVKREGDGKSPAGVFHLSAAFGYATLEEMGELAVPYTYVTDRLECVDDADSGFYNQIVLRDAVDEVDWKSSEQMLMDSIWYEKGIVVDHNSSPVRPGAGSCIFLHNWSGPEDTTSGCTAMAPWVLTEIVYWLDSDADPVLVQLTESLYEEYQKAWGLPGPFPIDN
jgi:D-alanyl-D-alanine dipeptidase